MRSSAPSCQPSTTEAASDLEAAAAAFAATGAAAGTQAIWRSTFRWLRGLDGATSTVVPDSEDAIHAGGNDRVAVLVAELESGPTEPVRMGAAYQLAEFARAGGGSASSLAAVEALSNALDKAATAQGLLGQHGCAEHRMRAAHYGLGAAGDVARPLLLRLLSEVDWSAGPRACLARRVLHALGDAVSKPSLGDIATVCQAYGHCCRQLDAYQTTLPPHEAGNDLFTLPLKTEADVEALPSPARQLRAAGTAGIIQHEPTDEYGAELHMVAATCMQCLSAWCVGHALTSIIVILSSIHCNAWGL